VCTLDQALLSVLPTRHQSLRLLGLGRKILLVDEVHAYDPYMQKLLYALLEAQARQGGSVILLSATLPQVMRQNLVTAFHSGLAQEAPQLNTSPAYPLITHTPTPNAEDIETSIDTRAEVKRTVKIHRLANETDVFETIRTNIAAGHCVCWIRNTVKAARLAYQTLLNVGLTAEQVSLFHSRFAMQDRQIIEQATLAKFGKASTQSLRQGQVLIATQVVEQSLDLDFDVLITDLAPIDLIIQRAGRLRRHIRDCYGNPLQQEGAQDERGTPVLYLHTPEPLETADANWLKPDHKGTQSIYPHLGQLWLTAHTLLNKGQWTMPIDARYLIDSVYSPEAIYPKALEIQSINAEVTAKSQESMADFNVLKLHKGYTRLSGDWDEDIRIPTRLTEQETVSVALVILENNQLKPYATAEHFAWDLSTIKLPEPDWQNAQKAIPNALKEPIENLKKTHKQLRWLEVFPLVASTHSFYSATDGWQSDPGSKL
jgi:CRISPR-associated endonuclease/helicase Cas3